jgi:hypothetical protein
LELIDLTINVIITIRFQFLATKYNMAFKSLFKIPKKRVMGGIIYHKNTNLKMQKCRTKDHLNIFYLPIKEFVSIIRKK